MTDKKFKKLERVLDRNMRKLEKLKKRVDTKKRLPIEYEYIDYGKN